MKHFLYTLAICTLCCCTVSSAADEKTSKPNVIVILADDLGWGDVSCNQPEQGKVITPAIDKLPTNKTISMIGNRRW